MIKRLIGILIAVSLVAAGTIAFAAELNVGAVYYTKFLDRNSFDPAKFETNQNGVGIRSELQLNLDSKVSDRAEMGARILTVWDPAGFADGYSDWSGWFAGGANLWQVRGMWLKFYPVTIPMALKSVLIGTSDWGMFSPWTIGKVRYTERDNGKIILFEGGTDKGKYNVAMIPCPPWAGPDWTCGPNPRKSWVYSGNVTYLASDAFTLKLNGSRILAMQQKTGGDETEGAKRFDNIVGAVEGIYTPNPVYNISGLLGFSRYTADPSLVGGASARHDWSPHIINVSSAVGANMKLDAIASDPFGIGLTLKGEVFSISPDFVSILAARRETNVLLTEGHLRYGADQYGSTWRGNVGFTPSPLVDNGYIDWNETNYQSCIGTSGITLVPEYRAGALGIKGEVSMTSSNYNSQNVDTNKYWWFGSAYQSDNPLPPPRPRIDESSWLAAVRGDYLIPFGTGLGVFGKVKMANWKDGVNKNISTDDLVNEDTEVYAGASYQLTDEIGVTGGYKILNYLSKGNGTSASAKTYELQAGMIFAEVKANVGGVDMALFVEKVDGEDKVTSADVNDMRLKGTVEVKI